MLGLGLSLGLAPIQGGGAYARLLADLRASSAWAKMDAAWLLAVPIAGLAVNLKDPASYPLTLMNSPAFTPNRGYASNGTSSYIKTGFVPSSNAVQLQQNSSHFCGFYLTERAAASTYPAAVNSPTNRLLGFSPRLTGDLAYHFNNGLGGTYVTKSSKGMFCGVRDGSSSVKMYRNGLLMGAATTTSVGLSAVEVILLANNNNGSIGSYDPGTLSFYCIGAELTASEQVSVNNSVQRYLLSIGALSELPINVTCDGNSLTSGTGSSGGLTYPVYLNEYLTTTASKYNTVVSRGVSGQTTQQMTSSAADVDIDLTAISSKRVLVAWECFNDIRLGATPTQAVDNLETYCNARRAAGWQKILVCNMLNHGTQGSWTKGTSNVALNSELASRYANFADGLIDLASISALSDNTNLTYWNADGVHLTSAGYALVAPVVGAAVIAV